AGGLSSEAVRAPVALDAEIRVREIVQHAIEAAAEHEPRAVVPLFAERHADRATVQLDAILPAADRVDLQAILLAAIREVDALPHRRRHLRERAGRGLGDEVPPRVEPRALIGEDPGDD